MVSPELPSVSDHRVRRGGLRLFWIALLVTAVVTQGCILAVPPEVYATREKAEYIRGFGYASLGFAGHVGMLAATGRAIQLFSRF